MLPVIVDVICDKKIKAPVMIVVKPCRSGRPTPLVRHSCRRGHVRESAVTIVVEKYRPSVAGHINIGKTIVIEVGYSHSNIESFRQLDPALEGNVAESSIPIVVVEGRLWERCWIEVWGSTTVHKESIEKSILVVVQPCATRSHRLHNELF